MKSGIMQRALALALAAVLSVGTLSAAAFAEPKTPAALAAAEPAVEIAEIPWQAVDANGNPYDTTVKQYTFTFASLPETAEEFAAYSLDSPYKAMALLILAYRTWTPEDPSVCLRALDRLTDTGATLAGTEQKALFSQYTPWVNALKERMEQNGKYRFIGNAYLGGASPENNYAPEEPYTITLRESVFQPYAPATETAPEQQQVLIHIDGAENDRYSLFFQDADTGEWKVYGVNWRNLLADIQTAAMDVPLPPAYEAPAQRTLREPELKVETVPARAAGVDEAGMPVVIDTTVEQYTYTFSDVPATYEELLQFKLDSPYKTMALLFLAFRTWGPSQEAQQNCWQMLDYLTNTNVDSGQTDAEGNKLSKPFSEYNQWTSFLKDRMTQNEKYRYIGNAYLGGATPANDYTPDDPVTVTLRQSTYDPYHTAYQGITGPVPELKQVLIHIDGADNDRYSLLYQDQRGDWRIWGDNWQGLLADVRKPYSDVLFPPEYTVPENPAHPQEEPQETIYEIPAQVPGTDDMGEPVILDTTVKQHTFTFTTVPTCYEDIVQYKLDSPYKTMALLILAYRTWTPENPKVCLEMLDYLTNTDVASNQTDAEGHKLSKKFSEHQFWYDFVRDRMRDGSGQFNYKYRYIGNAYLEGAMPSNDYTPSDPVTITVRESVYNPYRPSQAADNREADPSDPTLFQVMISIPGADNDRYSVFYQDQRGDWRVFGEFWKGLLTDVKTPSGAVPLPPEVVRTETPKNIQNDPEPVVRDVSARALETNENGEQVVVEATVKEYTYTFTTIPRNYEDIVQYKLDSPYKTMALLFLAYCTWSPDNPTDCAEMLDYLTCTAVEKPGSVDGDGHKLCYAFSEYNPWLAYLADRMKQNEKYRFIGNAYLNGASPENNYTPSSPVSVTVRQSIYDPYKAASETSPELKQVMVSIAGAENDRYSVFYQDQRGDWRVFGDHWLSLLADVQMPSGDIPWPPEAVRGGDSSQQEPAETVTTVEALAPTEDGGTTPVQVEEHTFTFTTVPKTYEELVQYRLDSPYKAMALLILAYRTWTPDNPETCARMLDYLTNTAVAKSGAADSEGHKLSVPFSEYNPWVSSLADRMKQNGKYRYIGDAYLKGAAPDNDYTPEEPVTITVRQSVYDPYKAAGTGTPELKQVMVSIAGAENDRYSVFYQDQRGDWRVYGEHWLGLLTDVQTPSSDRRVGALFSEEEIIEAAGDAQRILAAVYDGEGRMLRLAMAEVKDGTPDLGAILGLSTEGALRVKLLFTDSGLAPAADTLQKITVS